MPSHLFQIPFDIRLLLEAYDSRHDELPKDLPVLTMIAGNKQDVYADSEGVTNWVKNQKEKGSKIAALQCDESKHELDNEFEPIGQEVRRQVAAFSQAILKKPGLESVAPSSHCRAPF